jgi:4-hydroxybenzoyl-CoA thioesterase
MVFERNKLIRFHHCDPAGIVFYPQYFILFQELVEDWFNYGLDRNYARFVGASRLGIPMAHVTCDFKIPSKIGDILTLRLAVTRIGNTSMALRVEGRAEGESRLSADLTIVLASMDTLKPTPIPPDLRRQFAQYLV